MNRFLILQMKKPKPYGIFHSLSLIIFILLTLIIFFKAKNINDFLFSAIVFVCWLLIFSMELLKQYYYIFLKEKKGVYKFEAFPLQMCSLPLYLYPLIIFLNDSQFKDGIMLFSATYLLFGGLIVLIFPTTFKDNVFLNIQTMLHHGIEVVVGFLIIIHKVDIFNYNTLIITTIIYWITIVLAISINEIVYPFLKEGNNNLNLLYISSHNKNEIPIISKIYEKSYLLFLLVYLSFIYLISFLIFLIVHIFF